MGLDGRSGDRAGHPRQRAVNAKTRSRDVGVCKQGPSWDGGSLEQCRLQHGGRELGAPKRQGPRIEGIRGEGSLSGSWDVLERGPGTKEDGQPQPPEQLPSSRHR